MRKTEWIAFVLGAILVGVAFAPIVSGASLFVGNPSNCPTSDGTRFPGQDCAPLEICGDSSGIAQCFDTDTISAPGIDLNSTTDWNSAFNGGYLTDCYRTVDAAAPFCDNSGAFWCDRNSTCQSVNRTTTCLANTFEDEASASICSGCTPPFIACDGSTTDGDGCETNPGVTACSAGANNNLNASCTCVCDSGANDCDGGGAGSGNGCEIVDGATCTVGSLTGTFLGCSGSAGNCVIAKSDFETGTNTQYNEDVNSFLWGINFGDGNLMSFFSGDWNRLFRIDANANLFTDGNINSLFDINGLQLCIQGDCRSAWADVGGGIDTTLDTNEVARNRFLGTSWDWNATQDMNGFSTGDALAGEFDLIVGVPGDGFGGCLKIGDYDICDTGNMGVVDNLNLDNFLIFRDMDGDSNISFMFITPGTLPRFVIPREGPDFATNNFRSFILGGDIGQALDEDIIRCSANGYDKIDCDTNATGADLGVQDDAQIRGSLFVDTNITSPRIDTVDLNAQDANFNSKGLIQINPRYLDVNNGELTFDTNTQDLLHFFDGTILETIDVDVNSNGTDVNLFIGREDGGDITLVFNNGYFLFDTTPLKTITLTAGSDTNPTLNYVFIPNSTQVLTVNTTGFPTDAEFASIATVEVQSASGVQIDGPYKVHVWTDHSDDKDTHQGHQSEINSWIRNQAGTWMDGVVQTLTITTNAGRPDAVDFAVTSGTVLQLHNHAYPAFDTASDSNIFIVNDSGAAFTKIDDLNALLTDSTGASMSNDYFTLVIWGVVSENAIHSKLMLNLPSGSYNKESDAIDDVSGFANFSIPVDFRGTGFLISKLVLRHQPASGGTWTSIQETDLRGLFPSTAAAGGSGVVTTTFPDNLFEIFNVTDSTKQLRFDLSGIATGNERLWTAQDANGTIPLLEFNNVYTADQNLNDNVNLSFGNAGDATFKYDGTNLVVNPKAVGSGFFLFDTNSQLCFRDDQGCVNSPSSGRLQFVAAGAFPQIEFLLATTPIFTFGAGGARINDDQGNINFQVKGDTKTHLFFTGATDNTATFGSITSLAFVGIDGQADEVQFLVQGNGTQTSDLFVVENSGGTDLLSVGLEDVNISTNLNVDGNVSSLADINSLQLCLTDDCIDAWADVNTTVGVTGIVAGGNIDVNSLTGHVRIDLDDGNFTSFSHLWSASQEHSESIDINANNKKLTLGTGQEAFLNHVASIFQIGTTNTTSPSDISLIAGNNAGSGAGASLTLGSGNGGSSGGGLVFIRAGTGDGDTDKYVVIGETDATSHSLDAINDLLIIGELEVDGPAFFDSNVVVDSDFNVNGDVNAIRHCVPDGNCFDNDFFDRSHIWTANQTMDGTTRINFGGTSKYIGNTGSGRLTFVSDSVLEYSVGSSSWRQEEGTSGIKFGLIGLDADRFEFTPIMVLLSDLNVIGDVNGAFDGFIGSTRVTNTTQDLYLIYGGTTMNANRGYQAICDGSIVGLGGTLQVGVSALGANWDLIARVDGVDALSISFDASSTGQKEGQTHQARGVDTFNEGDTITMFLDETAGAATVGPTTASTRVQYDC